MFLDYWNGLPRVAVFATLSYFALVTLLRISAKRTLSKMNAFDLVVTVAIGDIIRELLRMGRISNPKRSIILLFRSCCLPVPNHSHSDSLETTSPSGDSKGFDPRRLFAAAVALLLIILVVAMYQWMTGTTAEQLARWGYAGVFLIMVVSGSSTFFPVPGQASVLASGALWNPVLVGIAAGLGNATGETIGYLVARAATSMFEQINRSQWVLMFRGWFERYGFFAILGIAMIPNPVFDIVGIVAATAAYPLRRFWIACALGNSVKYIGMAYFGKAASSLFGGLF